ncbi:MAG: hypothetical protein WDO74_29870 [Pseudomonadota bacterium]
MDRALLASLVLLNAGTALVACSGVSVTAEGAAGSHAGGGASGAVSPPGGGSAGAGGAPVLRPAQANLALSLQPTTGAVNCPVPGMTYVVGNPDGPTDVTPGDRLIDGEHGASIMCSVRGSGPYTFSGTIHAASSQNDPVTVTITNGVINADKRTGSATVSVITPATRWRLRQRRGGLPRDCGRSECQTR